MTDVGTCSTRRTTRTMSQPSAIPAATLPTTASRNAGATPAKEKVFIAAAPTATASGGATMAPSAIAAAHGIAGTSACATSATATVVSATATSTSAVTGAQ